MRSCEGIMKIKIDNKKNLKLWSDFEPIKWRGTLFASHSYPLGSIVRNDDLHIAIQILFCFYSGGKKFTFLNQLV